MDDPAYRALRAAGEDLDDPDRDQDPGGALLEVDDEELAAEADRITGELAREVVLLAGLGLTGVMAAQAAVAAGGRRGPGMPGSADRVPGISVSRAAGFASGMPLDVAPGCLELARFAEDAAGPDDRYRDASDD